MKFTTLIVSLGLIGIGYGSQFYRCQPKSTDLTGDIKSSVTMLDATCLSEFNEKDCEIYQKALGQFKFQRDSVNNATYENVSELNKQAKKQLSIIKGGQFNPRFERNSFENGGYIYKLFAIEKFKFKLSLFSDTEFTDRELFNFIYQIRKDRKFGVAIDDLKDTPNQSHRFLLILANNPMTQS